ncbi:MAG: alpha/beta hydrolase [bacterium]|nr:alpha/beta hydrolase [bacterium]
MKNALIIHGTEGYPEENWFPWIKKKLKEHDYQVFVPQFPTPENQTPEHWFDVIKTYEKFFNEETILIGHSCGGAFLLRVLEHIDTRIKAAVFVATSVGIKPIKYYEVDYPFVEKPFDWRKISSSAENFFVFHSEDDPFICLDNGKKIAQEVRTDLITLNDAGHFNAKAGYTTFELLLEKLKPIL